MTKPLHKVSQANFLGNLSLRKGSGDGSDIYFQGQCVGQVSDTTNDGLIEVHKNAVRQALANFECGNTSDVSSLCSPEALQPYDDLKRSYPKAYEAMPQKVPEFDRLFAALHKDLQGIYAAHFWNNVPTGFPDRSQYWGLNARKGWIYTTVEGDGELIAWAQRDPAYLEALAKARDDYRGQEYLTMASETRTLSFLMELASGMPKREMTIAYTPMAIEGNSTTNHGAQNEPD